jgi:chromosome segregation ATPase
MKTQVSEQNDMHSTEISQLLSKWEVSERKIQTLEKQCDISRMDSLEKSKEVSRYKGELGKALEQCAKLDREKAQLSLEHQQEREEVEIRVCHQNESLIVELTGARDRALAEVERLKRCLQEAQTTFEDFKNEKNKKTNEVASLQALQQQNEQLK